MPENLALVLSGGGARAAYQAGVVSAIAEICPTVAFQIITGVSAGAINAAYLAAGTSTLAESARALRGAWEGLTADRVYRLRPTGLAMSTARRLLAALLGRNPGPARLSGLLDLEPLRNYLGGAIPFRNIDENITAGRLRALALSATPYAASATRTFVHGLPDIPLWERAERTSSRASITVEHVLASAAIPIIFPAIWLDGAFYADGSVRQTAPLAPAIHLGASRVLVIGTRHGPPILPPQPQPQPPTAAEGIGLLFNAVFLDALDADSERLTRMNHLIASIPAGVPIPHGLRPVRFLHLRPSRELSSFVPPGEHRRLPWAMRIIVRAMGGEAAGSTVLLSYLLFDPSFTGRLMELGYEDARTQAEKVERFFAD